MWIWSHHKFAAHLAEVGIMKNFLADLPIPVGCPGILMGEGCTSASLPFWPIGLRKGSVLWSSPRCFDTERTEWHLSWVFTHPTVLGIS